MNKNAIKSLTVIFIVIAALLSIHFFNISLIQSGTLARNAAVQRASSQNIKSWRGCIYDCNMIPLTDRQAHPLTAATGDAVDVFSRYDGSSVAEHLLGYTLSDGTGAAGIEKAYNSVLQSDTHHSVKYISDAAGNPISSRLYAQQNTAYIPENNIKLTLDYKIQKIVDTTADKLLHSGAIVIVDCSTFDVKAMVSRPGYDQNNIAQSLRSPDSPLLNKAVSAYDAGSVFKIITSAAAMESDDAPPRAVNCTGRVMIDGKEFLCHEAKGHGETDFDSAFANSCNSYFYRLAGQCGADAVISMAQRFGLGRSLCTNAVTDSSGTLPLREKYSPRECANIAIGQGEILITPLQATYMTAVIANNGTGKAVNIADSIVDEKGNTLRNLRSSDTDIVISADTAAGIGKMMRQCVTDGTAHNVQNGKVAIAGKTGTAQTGWLSDGVPMVHGWFCGFFPYENPKYAMTVFYENGQSGSAACIPIFKEIVLEIDKLYN